MSRQQRDMRRTKAKEDTLSTANPKESEEEGGEEEGKSQEEREVLNSIEKAERWKGKDLV